MERKGVFVRPVFLTVGILIFVAIQFVQLPSVYQKNALSILCIMAFYWITETMPLWITSLLPFILFPIFPVVDKTKIDIIGFMVNEKEAFASFLIAVSNFFDQNLGLFLGGMVIGAAMQMTGLHRRIALNILNLVGVNKGGLILGFLAATAFMSMWISNTATAVMMLPIAISVVKEMRKREGHALPFFSAVLVLTVAYGANLGGIGTKIGTAPNVLFCAFAEKKLDTPVDFLHYFKIGLPIVLLILPFIWLILIIYSRRDELKMVSKDLIYTELEKLGKMSIQEKFVVVCFLVAVFLWIFGKPIGEKIKMAKQFDSLVAMFIGIITFVIPVRGQPVNDRRSIKLISWDALILLGGSFALAAGVQESRLTGEIASSLSAIVNWEPFLIMLMIAGITVFASAFTSNTATCSVILPVVYGAFGKESFPYLALVGVSSSLDFMLPAGTPPNAIVFSSGFVKISQMVKIGFLLDVLSITTSALWIYIGLYLLRL